MGRSVALKIAFSLCPSDTFTCLSVAACYPESGCVCVSVRVFLGSLISLFFLCAAKPQTSLRQPNHRGRGGNRGGGGCGRGGGHGDFRQARDVRDGQPESKPGGHPNKTSSQSAASRKGNPPGEK